MEKHGISTLLCQRPSSAPGSPAAVLAVCVQGRLGPSQPQADEGMVEGECHIAEAVNTVRLIIDVLPVGAEARGSRRIVAIQVRVQLPNDFLVHYGFELSGKEGGPGSLLCSGEIQDKFIIKQCVCVIILHPARRRGHGSKPWDFMTFQYSPL